MVFKVLESIAELVGWIKIMLSPLLIGFLIGLIIYGFYKNKTGLALGITTTIIGLVIGIVWATRVSKRQGTNNFLSRIYGTPELDSEEKKEN